MAVLPDWAHLCALEDLTSVAHTVALLLLADLARSRLVAVECCLVGVLPLAQANILMVHQWALKVLASSLTWMLAVRRVNIALIELEEAWL